MNESMGAKRGFTIQFSTHDERQASASWSYNNYNIFVMMIMIIIIIMMMLHHILSGSTSTCA